MNYLKFALVLSTLCFLGLSRVEAASRPVRETETPTVTDEANSMGKVQEQLLTAFDSFKKSMEELASKINTEEIVQGLQSFTQKLETYAKETADKISSSAAGTTTTDTETPKTE